MPQVHPMSDDDTSQQPQSKRQRTTHDSRSVDTSSSMSIYDSGHDQGPQGNPYPPPTESTVAAAAVAVQGVVMQKQKQVSPRNRAKIDMSPHASHAADLHHQTQKAPPRSMALAAMAAVMMSTDASSSSSPPGPEMDPSLTAATEGSGSGSSVGGSHHALSTGVPRLPPILQVEKQQVTTSATQMASASRRRNEAHFVCPVPGCGSTFTRRFNLRGHLRSHTEERPYVCQECKKGFARQHDRKRHQALHASKSQNNVCQGCKKPFSRLDALNRHLRSEGGSECRKAVERNRPRDSQSENGMDWEGQSDQGRQ